MSTDDGLNVAAELAKLRGELTVGLEQIKGQLNLIAQSQSQTREDLNDLEDSVSKLDIRVSALEERRIPLGVVAAMSGVVSVVVAVVALLVQ